MRDYVAVCPHGSGGFAAEEVKVQAATHEDALAAARWIGWYCPQAPARLCDYAEDDGPCVHCGKPSPC